MRVKFLARNGKDLFEYMRRAQLDTNLANNWALENFVVIDGKKLDVTDIVKLTDVAYLTITSKVFSFDDPKIEANNEGIKYENILVKPKKVKRDFITELQTTLTNTKNDNVAMMKKSVTSMYDVTVDELEKMPFQLVGFLINRVNFFLQSLTTPTDEFTIDDVWNNDTEKIDDGSLGNLV